MTAEDAKAKLDAGARAHPALHRLHLPRPTTGEGDFEDEKLKMEDEKSGR